MFTILKKTAKIYIRNYFGVTMKPTISIITPVYNEQESLPLFFKRVVPIMENIGLPFEIIAVNDGSRDASESILKEQCEKDKRIKAVNFSRNFGQQAAFLCGLTVSVVAK